MEPGMPYALDRRAHLAHCQDVLEKARRRLPMQERQLLAVWERRLMPVRQLAATVGCHHATLYRRLKRIRIRLGSPAVLALTHRGRDLPVLTYTIAMRRHLLGQTPASIARDLALSRARVLQVLAQFSGWLLTHRRTAAGQTPAASSQGVSQ